MKTNISTPLAAVPTREISSIDASAEVPKPTGYAMKIKEHLALRNIYLMHADTEAFVSCKCKAPVRYIIWRTFWAVYHCSWLIANILVVSLQEETSVVKWFIYLSNWMYLLLTLESILEAVVVVNAYRRPELVESSSLPWYIRLMWLLYTLTVTGAIMVCLWYWTFIHKGRELTAIRFNTHGVAALYVILNMVVTRLPLRLLHFLYPVAFGVLYTLFSAIYFCLGGTSQNGERAIYSVLDWTRPGRTIAISSLSNFVFIPIVHLLMWGLSLLFQIIYDRLRKRHVVYNQSLNCPDTEEIIIE